MAVTRLGTSTLNATCLVTKCIQRLGKYKKSEIKHVGVLVNITTTLLDEKYLI